MGKPNNRNSRRLRKAEANQNKTANTQGEASPKSTPNPTTSFAFFPKIYPCPICYANSGQKKKYSSQWWKVRLEIAGIIGALCAVIIYFFQMLANQGQADAAYKQFAVMTNQLAEMHQDFISDERAWVNAYDVDIRHTNADPTVSVILKNTGKTPAFHVHSSIFFTVDTNQIPQTDKFDTPHSDLMMAPGQMNLSEMPIKTIQTPEVITHIMNGGRGYYFGTVWYDDIFGSHHWSQYCFIVGTDIQGTGFRPAPFHNGCDADKSANK